MEHWGAPDSNPLQFLTSPKDLKWFVGECWEKKPHVFEATGEKKKVFDGLFTCDSLKNILKEREALGGAGPLNFGIDLNAAMYVNGVRETPNGEVGDSETVWGLFEKGATLQFIQPQRFQENLRALCAALESQLGCLVGCNAYITPKGTQGLAPHHDDVELFICQTEGSKTWRLHTPINNYSLPALPSGNLSQEEAGEPIKEVTLNVGDVLYMPKGTVHQAVAQKANSVHLTISTYQRWSWGDLALTLMQHAMTAKEPVIGAPLALREGLPHGFVNTSGALTGKSSAVQVGMKELAKRLHALADAVEKKESLFRVAVDSMAEDVISGRMPPLEEQMPEKGAAPTLRDSVRVRGTGLFRLMPVESDEGGVDPSMVQLVSCLKNPVHKHMIAGLPSDCDSDFEEMMEDEDEECEITACCPSEKSKDEKMKAGPPAGAELAEGSIEDVEIDEDEDGSQVLVLESSFTEAVQQILGAGSQGVPVRSLKLETDQLKMGCVTALWEDGMISTLPSENGSKGKTPKKARKK
ncbi:hypothetical protein BSKO_08013 [Bryopsis sp. KO-2023]|nr:hypothetical protein BSKO_08013 [Bryopsis sp. KO-2023]